MARLWEVATPVSSKSVRSCLWPQRDLARRFKGRRLCMEWTQWSTERDRVDRCIAESTTAMVVGASWRCAMSEYLAFQRCDQC
jgi:hypothetical protein